MRNKFLQFKDYVLNVWKMMPVYLAYAIIFRNSFLLIHPEKSYNILYTFPSHPISLPLPLPSSVSPQTAARSLSKEPVQFFKEFNSRGSDKT